MMVVVKVKTAPMTVGVRTVETAAKIVVAKKRRAATKLVDVGTKTIERVTPRDLPCCGG